MQLIARGSSRLIAGGRFLWGWSSAGETCACSWWTLFLPPDTFLPCLGTQPHTTGTPGHTYWPLVPATPATSPLMALRPSPLGLRLTAGGFLPAPLTLLYPQQLHLSSYLQILEGSQEK